MQQHHIRVILFDLGGTLVQKLNHGSRDPVIIAKMAEFLKTSASPEELINLLTRREKEYKDWTYRSLEELSYADRWSKFLLPEYPHDFIREHAARLQAWWSDSRGKRWITPETIQTLQALRQRGYTLGTVSHTSPKYLDAAGIRDWFKTTLQAADFGKRKPHPAPFIAAARNCGVTPVECAYVGDRPSRDVIGSRQAGIGQVVIIAPPGRDREAVLCPMQADITIGSLPEILEHFPKVVWSAAVPHAEAPAPKLYDAALSTMWWRKETDNAAAFFMKGRRLGFARFELNHQVTPAELETVDLNRYHVGSVHDPCPAVIPNKQLERGDKQITSLVEDQRIFGVDTLKRTIELANNLGSRLVVIHPGRIPGDHSLDNRLRDLYRQGLKGTPQYDTICRSLVTDRKERSQAHLDALLKSLEEIVQFSRDSGLFLSLENRFHYYELPVFDEMQTILETFQQPWIGWQLDVGHIQVHHCLGLMNFQEWLEAFSHRILGVHLHDVSGIVDHQAPGRGDVDFVWLSSFLPQHAYRTLEINSAIPFEEFKQGLLHLEKTGCITSI